ncbi:sensor histidine kinase [Clostridium estertheticum]|uniref:histidine kinase n=1 Tax=Clostridium estertheticum subsp. estertheticum TaxID=1552 RepID=A0A1J0GFR5_9CLOT|nr:PocR ligand-binding domain-containing protein [Clostridium estertheticum]APC40165.1 histidine kinase [Clostridium estertheticum subsp. estertheticum]MBU3072315.1 PocR ligand-binding domain-containing protein [Clostridium estertheticum]MBU3162408.1 PocR ligand-binding domain-containing protein [Clostridium estertheticum]MBZ9618048.1 PocR ligand-binding domain-containing protein [Clostridium estertheticum subsp. laramiense]WAG73705.1 PocR ligand-binding domain-containing protein [Clostridium 
MINKARLKITDILDVELLQKLQDNFSKNMDIASVIVDINGNPVTKPSRFTNFCTNFIQNSVLGNNKCSASHRKCGEGAAKSAKPYICRCHAGLIDFAAPILVNGEHIGTILGGQFLIKKPSASDFKNIIKEPTTSENRFLEALSEINVIEEQKLKLAVETVFIIANSISQMGYEKLNLKLDAKKMESSILDQNRLLEESRKCNMDQSEMFSSMSHELKTPLNIIFSALQLLESKYDTKSVVPDYEMFSKYSKVMKQNCYRLIRLINNLIDMNKIELGFFKLELANGNIVKTIEDITLSVVTYAKAKKISIVFDTDIEEKITSFDSGKLERIMLNILSNAIKFTEADGIINVNIYDNENYILIKIKDTGIGIPQNMLNKIFNTYIQVDDSLRGTVEGNGIGLSLVKSLVEMHGGDISVKSEMGVGSEFSIKLPIKLIESQMSHRNKNYNINDPIEKIKIEFSDIFS